MDTKAPVERFKCPGCSADMQFDPQTGGLKCAYCGATQKVSHPVNAVVEELDYERYSRASDPALLGQMSSKALEVTCSSCGSTTQFEPGAMSGQCPFCAASIVMQPKTANPLIAPNAVLAFKLPKQQATASVQQWLSSRWFAPSGLKSVTRPEGIQGVYVPFWTFDAQTNTRYRGQRGDYYYEEEMFTAFENGQEVRRSRQVRKTRWSPCSGRVENAFDDVLIPATKAIDRKRLQELDPWDLETVTPYEPAYLAGFQAQRYQVELPEGLAEAKAIMNAEIEHSVCRDIGGDEQNVESLDSAYRDVTFKHVLLPVWIGAYRFQGKVFQVTINARTGEVQGDRPYSAGKIALLVIAILVLILILVSLSK
ncbi:MAG: hypothetical protein U0Q16_32445 [Bryobacteraceae bacterium]